MIAAMHVALGLVFDPRYKDFPLAALTGPVVALAILAFAGAAATQRPGWPSRWRDRAGGLRALHHRQ